MELLLIMVKKQGFISRTRSQGSPKNNPNPELAAKQKRENKKQAATRIVVEHSIGGMKHFHCLMHRIRNHLDIFIDYFFCLSGGLWNLKISL
ncbi:MAG: transposase family protein [Methylococcaceae bacterium]|nr:transposase family protein [Methylococcaceae bacterium]